MPSDEFEVVDQIMRRVLDSFRSPLAPLADELNVLAGKRGSRRWLPPRPEVGT